MRQKKMGDKTEGKKRRRDQDIAAEDGGATVEASAGSKRPPRTPPKARPASSPVTPPRATQPLMDLAPLAVETPEFAEFNDPDHVVVKRSALKNAVDSQKRCQQALKQAQRICTASAQAFNYEADVLGECKAALDRPL